MGLSGVRWEGHEHIEHEDARVQRLLHRGVLASFLQQAFVKEAGLGFWWVGDVWLRLIFSALAVRRHVILAAIGAKRLRRRFGLVLFVRGFFNGLGLVGKERVLRLF